MKRRRARSVLGFVACCLAGLSTSERADALEGVAEDIRDANNCAGVMIGARYLSYEELNNGLAPTLPQVLDAEHGWLTAVRLEGRLQGDLGALRNTYVRALVEYASGDVAYDGRTQPTGPGGSVPVTATSYAGIGDLGAEAGVGIPLGSAWALTPLARYRFRHWDRTLGKGTPGTFRETYHHHELAAGALAQVVLTTALVAGVAATLGGTLAPMQAIEGSPEIQSSLGNALVFRGELTLAYAVRTDVPRIHLVAAYELGTFAYGRSSTIVIGNLAATEPDSRTFEHELRAGVAIGF